jgi:hypothetical protein
MLSQQDIFLQITQEEMLHFDANQQLISRNQFGLNGAVVNAVLTNSHIFLSQVLFNFIQVNSSNQWFSL